MAKSSLEMASRRTQKIKVAALQAARPPEPQADVCSFLFFELAKADFMEGFAQAAAPQRALLQKDERFRWTKECQQSFEHVKSLFSSDTILVYSHPQRTNRLETDPGPYGIAVT